MSRYVPLSRGEDNLDSDRLVYSFFLHHHRRESILSVSL